MAKITWVCGFVCTQKGFGVVSWVLCVYVVHILISFDRLEAPSVTTGVILFNIHGYLDFPGKFTYAQVRACPIFLFVGFDDGFINRIINLRLTDIDQGNHLQDQSKNEENEQFLHHAVLFADDLFFRVLHL